MEELKTTSFIKGDNGRIDASCGANTITLWGPVSQSDADTSPRVSVNGITRILIEGELFPESIDVRPIGDVGATFSTANAPSGGFPIELPGQGAVALVYLSSPEESWLPSGFSDLEEFLRSL